MNTIMEEICSEDQEYDKNEVSKKLERIFKECGNIVMSMEEGSHLGLNKGSSLHKLSIVT
jgi:hypothetical protein